MSEKWKQSLMGEKLAAGTSGNVLGRFNKKARCDKIVRSLEKKGLLIIAFRKFISRNKRQSFFDGSQYFTSAFCVCGVLDA